MSTKNGIQLIAEERQRQIEEEKFTLQRDIKCYSHNSNLEMAAVAYTLPNELPTQWQRENLEHRSNFFPWIKEYWKPTPNNRITELTKAGALIAAKIDVLLAIQKKESPINLTNDPNL